MADLHAVNWGPDRRSPLPDVYLVPESHRDSRLRTFLNSWKRHLKKPGALSNALTWPNLGRFCASAVGDVPEDRRKAIYALLLHQFAHSPRAAHWSDEEREQVLSCLADSIPPLPGEGPQSRSTDANAALGRIVRALKHSPVFQLSLASRELFHSNFLAWFCEEYPDHAGRIFAEFLRQPPPAGQPPLVTRAVRERKKIDLSIEFAGGPALLVENKVRSLPQRAQLEQYSAAVKNKADTGFLLLSLMPPTFLSPGTSTIRLDGDVIWHCLSYAELAERLSAVLPDVLNRNGYHGALLNDYIGLARQLDALRSHFVIDWGDPGFDFFAMKQKLALLRAIRIRDVFDKLRFAQLVERVTSALQGQGFDKIVDQRIPERQGEIAVRADMTRGIGLFDLKYVVLNNERSTGPVLLGVQIQGGQFRLNLEVKNKNLPAKSLAEALLRPPGGERIWFDLSHVAGSSDEFPESTAFNQYSGIFFYRYKKLASMAAQRLVDTIISYARLIREKQDALRRQIEGGLSSAEPLRDRA